MFEQESLGPAPARFGSPQPALALAAVKKRLKAARARTARRHFFDSAKSFADEGVMGVLLWFECCSLGTVEDSSNEAICGTKELRGNAPNVSLPQKRQSFESSGGNLRLSTSCSAPFSEPLVVKQPKFTRVEEPTLLCNHSYRRKVSDRTMVSNLTNVLLCWFRN